MSIRTENWLGHESKPVDFARASGYVPVLEFLGADDYITETIAVGYHGEYLALTDKGKLLFVSHWYGDSNNILVPNVARSIESILNGNTKLSEAFVNFLNQMLDRHYDGLLNQLPTNLSQKIEQLISYSRKERMPIVIKPATKTIEYVYFLTADNGLTKIGRTRDLTSRMHHFTTKLPYELVKTLILECEDSGKLEAELHSRFGNKRIRGEWFQLSSDDIAWVADRYRPLKGAK